ncbi:DUF2065 domain-containing protein [Roseinatronobacter ekhonensis]|uniref:DUF2065 domain-containing protein n=1 Tax=Roseinatronobacter ekhonensis TaxID=254356 RepID=UPI001FE5C5C3|nr:DUF2065 domain-containing protein [Roseibaca ekhonensis]
MNLSTLVLALGLVLILEGLVFALAPSRVEDLLRALSQLPEGARRLIGALALVLGVLLFTLSGMIAAP